MFPSGTIELEYVKETPFCSFELILTIIQDYNKDIKNLTVNQLKEILLEEYNKYLDRIPSIANILGMHGKVNMSQKLLEGIITIDTLIMSEDYYITNFDIELLAIRFNIPLILISSTRLVDNNKTLLIVNNTNSGLFYFVKVPGIKADTVLKYRLFILPDNLILPVHKFSLSMQQDIRKADVLDIDKFIESNKKKIKILPKKPQQKLKIVKKFEKNSKDSKTIKETDNKESDKLYISPSEDELLKALEQLEREEEAKQTTKKQFYIKKK